MTLSFGRAAAALVLLGAATGCAYQGDLADPVDRRLGWFDYVAATNVRAACGDGRTRWRLIHVGTWGEQVRAYDLIPAPGGGAALRGFVTAGDDLLGFALQTLLGPQAPGAPRQAERALSAAEVAALDARLATAGVGARTPAGLRLRADQFHQVAAGCRDGRFVYDAWTADEPRWSAIALERVLAPVDPIAAAAPFTRPDPRAVPRDPRDNLYTLTVGRDGLVAMPRLN